MSEREQFDKSRQQDTPRTDANLRGWNNELPGPFVEFTRQLERELVAMTADRDMWFKDDVKQNDALGRALAPSSTRRAPEPCLWWNGFSRYDERDGTHPSVSEREDTNHDIPLYSGVNPANIAPSATASTWIQVSERVPPDHEYYLCQWHFDGDESGEGDYAVGYYGMDKKWTLNAGALKGVIVTHWMPLPAAPCERNDISREGKP